MDGLRDPKRQDAAARRARRAELIRDDMAAVLWGCWAFLAALPEALVLAAPLIGAGVCGGLGVAALTLGRPGEGAALLAAAAVLVGVFIVLDRLIESLRSFAAMRHTQRHGRA